MIGNFCHKKNNIKYYLLEENSMQYLIIVIKRLVMAICMLYAVDLIISSTGVIIPINTFSIISVAVLGLPAVIGLGVIQKLM